MIREASPVDGSAQFLGLIRSGSMWIAGFTVTTPPYGNYYYWNS
jgi:hypothetical protein